MQPALLLAGALVLLVFLRRNDRRQVATDLTGSPLWPAADSGLINRTAQGTVPDGSQLYPPGTIYYDPSTDRYLT